jgi:hypothetical protein
MVGPLCSNRTSHVRAALEIRVPVCRYAEADGRVLVRPIFAAASQADCCNLSSSKQPGVIARGCGGPTSPSPIEFGGVEHSPCDLRHQGASSPPVLSGMSSRVLALFLVIDRDNELRYKGAVCHAKATTPRSVLATLNFCRKLPMAFPARNLLGNRVCPNK